MIRVLTIEREYGSGGGEIAAALAQRLGWKLWDQALTNEIARQMECDCRVVEERAERRDPLFHRLLMAFMRGSHEGSLNAPRLKLADADCIREVTEQVVKEAAQCGGCVIVGRGESAQLAETVDRDRAAFIKQYFNVDWPDRHRFHLMVNSGIGESATVDTILNSIDLYKKQLAQANAHHSVAS
jgi:hypothetical protein